MRGCKSRPLLGFCSLCAASLALAARLAAAVIPDPPAADFEVKSSGRATYLFSDLVFCAKEFGHVTRQQSQPWHR